MTKRNLLSWGIGSLILAVSVWAGAKTASADTVVYKKPDGNGGYLEIALEGNIVRSNKAEVVLQDKGKIETPVPANSLVTIQVDKEPVAMAVIRTAIESSQYEDALKQLAGIPADEKAKASDVVQQEIAFLTGYAEAQLALTGSKDISIKKAGGDLFTFTKTYPDSHRFYEANRLVGNLLSAAGSLEEAKKTFEALSEAPWDEMKVEGKVALGKISIGEKNYDQAKDYFNTVINTEAATPGMVEQRYFARIGLARVTVLEGDYDGAMAALNQIIDEASSDNPALMAALYNAIGESALEAGKNKEALRAFLHVDLLFSSARLEHIKALKNLITLWKGEMKEDRAAEAVAILQDHYGIVP